MPSRQVLGVFRHRLLVALGALDDVDGALDDRAPPDDGWWGTSAGLPVSGDQNADGRDDISIMYNYQSGATTAFVFTARTDGGFDSPNDSWQAAPGFW
ncbi:hypothetical protein [Embleya scabrispora]|uniref:hypothetical protein n=1 Tax=Embleya scabrispora TaxID=159449 RepID=UPI000367DB90|nr:hypothetical protein [Embleya scabrispora]MYS84327.1 hypothetical protein [Streptomyces sp. SID5474]